jgi:hypothetical protein
LVEVFIDSAELFDGSKGGVEERDTVPFEEPIDLAEVFVGSWEAGFAETVGGLQKRARSAMRYHWKTHHHQC